MNVLSQGAEGTLFIKNDEKLVKVREPKPYRHEQLDHKLRLSRTKREVKVLNRLKERGLNVPFADMLDKENCSFEIEYIKGEDLKNVLNEDLLNKAFEQIMKMHEQNIVHGDLTTLNMLVKDDEVYLIDFGLSEFSTKVEDKAVDLNLFFICIKNEHPNFFEKKEKLLQKYSSLEDGENVLEQLKKVEHRGRNK